jgi:hypothetical protein
MWGDYLWVGSLTVAEVGIRSGIRGWASSEALKTLESGNLDAIAGTPPTVIYSDSTLKSPSDCVQFGPVHQLRRWGKAVLMDVNALWVDAGAVEPKFGESGGERIFSPAWVPPQTGGRSIPEQADLEFKLEQREIRDSVAVYDTTIVMRRAMDLFTVFGNLIDLSWLPENQSESPSPTGLGISFRPVDGEVGADLGWGNGKFTLDDSTYVPGTEITLVSRGMKASLTFSDFRLTRQNKIGFESVKLRYKLWLFPVPEAE